MIVTPGELYVIQREVQARNWGFGSLEVQRPTFRIFGGFEQVHQRASSRLSTSVRRLLGFEMLESVHMSLSDAVV